MRLRLHDRLEQRDRRGADLLGLVKCFAVGLIQINFDARFAVLRGNRLVVPELLLNRDHAREKMIDLFWAPRKIDYSANRGPFWSERLRIGTGTKPNHLTAILGAIFRGALLKTPHGSQPEGAASRELERPVGGACPTGPSERCFAVL
jgi:hypothetical protein